MGGPVRHCEAPLLGELLSAAIDGAHLKVRYDSIESGITEQVIFPHRSTTCVDSTRTSRS